MFGGFLSAGRNDFFKTFPSEKEEMNTRPSWFQFLQILMKAAQVGGRDEYLTRILAQSLDIASIVIDSLTCARRRKL